jgi:hypothetical protein
MRLFDSGCCRNATIPKSRFSVSPPKNAAIKKIVNVENKALWEILFTGAADANIHASFFTTHIYYHDLGV